ncbi:MAG: hypothetical protein HY934_03760, partial [Candidatus Firestonebacteria bacterium]|nr:hypothetical protein [Candidatus Firestonebacteria bacterium]
TDNLRGRIDEIYIYSRALGATEAAEHREQKGVWERKARSKPKIR